MNDSMATNKTRFRHTRTPKVSSDNPADDKKNTQPHLTLRRPDRKPSSPSRRYHHCRLRQPGRQNAGHSAHLLPSKHFQLFLPATSCTAQQNVLDMAPNWMHVPKLTPVPANIGCTFGTCASQHWMHVPKQVLSRHQGSAPVGLN